MGILVIGIIALQAPEPTPTRQIVFVTSTPRYRNKGKGDFAPVTSNDKNIIALVERPGHVSTPHSYAARNGRLDPGRLPAVRSGLSADFAHLSSPGDNRLVVLEHTTLIRARAILRPSRVMTS